MTTHGRSDHYGAVDVGNGGAGTRSYPILRAPRFPGARPRGGATPALHAAGHGSLDARSVEIAAAIVAARVGGSFWTAAPALPTDQPLTVIRPSSRRDAVTLTARWSGHDDDPLVAPGKRRAPPPASKFLMLLPCRSWLARDSDPWTVLDRADRVVARVDDEFALLAAAAGKPVFDSVTSLPLDHAESLRRLARRIAHFAYTDPFHGHPLDVVEWIDRLGDWRRQIDANRRIGPIVGIAAWKRRAVGRILWTGRPAKFVRSIDPARVCAGSHLATWPSRTPPGLLDRAAAAHVPVARIEDGFIRSIGLGAHLHPPFSIVLDMTGIHYDPRWPSDLEQLLDAHPLGDRLRLRAAALIQPLIRNGITKYGAEPGSAIDLPRTPRRVLVIGQVEDDLSVRHGGAGIAGNLDLLRRVRAAEPDGFIVYKPHPDVAAGLRKGRIPDHDALRLADRIVTGGDLAPLLMQIDAVHVLTSLAGFEALLRGCEVSVHGQPFYAGWGLTTDLAPPLAYPRRRRRLTLEQLVAGALILYPRYLDPVTALPCPPEVLIARHGAMSRRRRSMLNWLRIAQGGLSLRRAALAGSPG